MAIFDHPGTPAAHALVIGVNDYPHLNGGSIGDSPVLQALGQLTSPVPSAEQFARWFTEDYSRSGVPRGSLRMLLSGGSYTAPDGTVHAVPVPTRKNIDDVFAEWFAACSQHKNNIALFFFCGHGIRTDALYLLPEDAGSSPIKPWDACIDFDLTLECMDRCTAETQCYFVDACQDRSSAIQARGKTLGSPLIDDDGSGTFSRRDCPVYSALGPDQLAYGNAGSPSVFTNALVQCLTRFGASPVGSRNPWPVTTDSLKQALAEWLDRTSQPGLPIALDPGGKVRFNKPLASIKSPEVLGSVVVISSSPGAQLAVELAPVPPGGSLFQGTPGATAWRWEIPPGDYTLKASLPPSAAPVHQGAIQALPPVMAPIEISAPPVLP
ncbi:MAG: caspase domain-containing protein [Verrucomicrobiales bacterium]